MIGGHFEYGGFEEMRNMLCSTRRASLRRASRNREIFLSPKSWGARRSLLSPSQDTLDHTQPIFCSNAVKTSKYTWWNFIPKNLFEQFRRVGNLFFLLIAIVQLALQDRSPVSPVPSVAAFLFVIIVAAIKQGVEDIKRHREDDKVNNAPCIVVRDGTETWIKSRDVIVGDLLKISEDENVPCDLVLVGSSNSDGNCYVTTANLDGEAHLKKLECISPSLLGTLHDPLGGFEGVIECEHPHPDLYKFYGRLCVMLDGTRRVFPLNSSNLLVGGSTLKETTYAYAFAVFTGPQSKLGQNLMNKPNKFSTAEKTMNTLVLFLLGLLLVALTVLTVLHHLIDDYPMQRELEPQDSRHFTDFLLFLILLNYLLPVSLYVSIEIQKLVGTRFFINDIDMYDEGERLWPKCNTSDINEELGQINYLFSDKTGTLTENVMRLRSLCVGGKCYHVTEDGQLAMDGRVVTLDVALKRLFVNILLNHTVQLDEKDGVPVFKASSPDEKAFLEAAYHLGVKYKGVNEQLETVIEFQGETCKYRVLNLLEFDAHRKCMSVIVRDMVDGEIYIMTKGAESSLETSMVDGVQKHGAYHYIEEFAASGLRTLVFGERKLDESAYSRLCDMIDNARCDIQDREAKLRSVYRAVETGLVCVGATGVEDVLQQGVKDTLVSLHRAGIHVWVLTGDKKSTAINVSFACGHFNKTMMIHELCEATNLDELDQKLSSMKENLEIKTQAHALVVDGKTLTLVMAERKAIFAFISHLCETVLCCRMSPLQKAQIVSMVKGFKERPVCAAIGDGANDVSMIQEAHLGIAIMGKEGRQATLCSDFAFAKFRFLKKAVLVHGHWYYYRISVFILYTVYKSVMLVLPQGYYSVHNLYSGVSLFDGVYLTCFNALFTAPPVIVFGVTEQHYPKSELLAEPELYRDLTKNRYMSAWICFSWILLAVYHSSVAFYMPYGMMANSGPMNEDGFAIPSLDDFGMIVYTIIVLVASFTLFYITKFWTVLSHGVYWFSLISYFGFSLIFTYFGRSRVRMSFAQVFSVAPPWLCVIVSLVVGLIPVLIILVVYNHRQSHSRFTMRRRAIEMQQLSVELKDSCLTTDSNLTNDSVMSVTPFLRNTNEDAARNMKSASKELLYATNMVPVASPY